MNHSRVNQRQKKSVNHDFMKTSERGTLTHHSTASLMPPHNRSAKESLMISPESDTSV